MFYLIFFIFQFDSLKKVIKKNLSILLDGVKIRNYTHEALHRLVTIVQQEPVLFARSIKENIMYGPFDKDESDMTAATKLSAANEFITNMSDGFDTQCGEKGQQLSGGQKQRIAIARSLGKLTHLQELAVKLSKLNGFYFVHARIYRGHKWSLLLFMFKKFVGKFSFKF